MSFLDRIRILVTHADPVARVGLSAAFEKCNDFVVDTTLDSPANLLKKALPFDVVVADYSTGVTLAKTVAHRGDFTAAPKIMVVAGLEREWEIRSALQCGVRGYFLQGCELDELVAGVRAVHRGARCLSARTAASLAESLSVEPLTEREEQVLRLVVFGLCNKAVSRRLGIAVGTVKSHLKSTYEKLNVESRTQAVAVVERRGLLRQVESAVEADSQGRPCTRSPAALRQVSFPGAASRQ